MQGPSTTLADLYVDIDAYGTYARPSALADYVEVVASCVGAFSEATLADLIKDNGWVRRMHDLIRLPDDRREDEPVEVGDIEEEGGVDEEPWRVAAAMVFDVLRDRADTLADSYPFNVTTLLERREVDGPYSRLYLALLALTISHAYGIQCDDLDPKQVFEETVEATLIARGLRSVNLGRAGRGGSSFDEVVLTSGESVGLRPTPRAAPYRVYANDERVDALAHLPWDDSRIASWTFIGQATCAASDEWARKLAEPGPSIWKEYLGIGTRPQPFLALPHHVDRPMFDYLVKQDERMILDRLRLCRRSDLLDSEEQLLACLETLDVQAP